MPKRIANMPLNTRLEAASDPAPPSPVGSVPPVILVPQLILAEIVDDSAIVWDECGGALQALPDARPLLSTKGSAASGDQPLRPFPLARFPPWRGYDGSVRRGATSAPRSAPIRHCIAIRRDRKNGGMTSFVIATGAPIRFHQATPRSVLMLASFLSPLCSTFDAGRGPCECLRRDSC